MGVVHHFLDAGVELFCAFVARIKVLAESPFCFENDAKHFGDERCDVGFVVRVLRVVEGPVVAGFVVGDCCTEG